MIFGAIALPLGSLLRLPRLVEEARCRDFTRPFGTGEFVQTDEGPVGKLGVL